MRSASARPIIQGHICIGEFIKLDAQSDAKARRNNIEFVRLPCTHQPRWYARQIHKYPGENSGNANPPGAGTGFRETRPAMPRIRVKAIAAIFVKPNPVLICPLTLTSYGEHDRHKRKGRWRKKRFINIKMPILYKRWPGCSSSLHLRLLCLSCQSDYSKNKNTFMKTKMLILSLLISAAAAAQNSAIVKSSSASALNVQNHAASLTGQNANSVETATKSKKISGATSLRGQVVINQNPKAEVVKAKSDKLIGSSEKEKQSLTASGSNMVKAKQTETTHAAKSSLSTAETTNASAQGNAKATIKTGEAKNAAVQKSAKASVSKISVKPHAIKVNTQIKTVAAIKII